ncbi:glycosyltransferase family 39 protein [Sphingomonas sp. BK235]|uniref:glycosyltransferase family 39 protein n=1 Tax=Sphingomonas sp. BK235 TaxID=2512131 RepID=UPI001046E3A8|nr:glycosyltransferase family 39 protein [Sphingomonas sp. BK235]TCP34088.1 dolichyl-phosphate-mannose-protein mannosyltransferase [Sphingomonas sp. BK235]
MEPIDRARPRPPSWPDARGGAAALAAAVLVAAAIRLALADYSLWFDELASVFFASQPLHRLWGAWMLRETNPPLFYTLLRWWIDAAGLSDAGLRVPGIVASLAAMAVIYVAVARRFGRRAAIAAALILALSPQQLYFSHQVRAYIVLYLAIAVSFAGLLQVACATAPRARAWGWAVYVAGAVAGIYCHTTGVIWPATATLALMLVDPRFRPLRGEHWVALLLAGVAIALAASWWLWMTFLQLTNPNGNLGWIKGLGLTKSVLIYVATLLQSRQVSLLQLPAPLLVAGFAALGAWRGRGDRATRLTLACLLVGTALFLLLNLKQPIFLDRTILWLSLFPLVLAASGVGGLRGRGYAAALIALALALGVSVALTRPHLAREDWRAVVTRTAADPRAALLVDGEAMAIATQMACRVELARAACPFAVVPLVAPGPQLDGWGRGLAASVGARGERLALATDARAYLLRRPFHDVLRDVQRAGLLRDARAVEPEAPVVAGPYPPALIDALARRTRVVDGVVQVAR